MTTTPPAPVVLRNGARIDDPLGVVLDSLQVWDLNVTDTTSFGEADLRHANRGGARIAAAEIAAILDRRPAIERALAGIAPDASLAMDEVPWQPLRQLFDAFAEIRGVGCSKTTKALHRKRPALIPMLDSVVQRHLADDDPGPKAPFADRAVALVRGYKRDLDRNRQALDAIVAELARRGRPLSAVRILDLLIWYAET